ncbi:MAG: CBS domain-containing protein [Nitrospiraceae bacterium]
MPTLSQLMNSNPVSVTPATTVRALAKKMKDGRIGSILIKKGTTYVGIVTETDVVRKVVATAKDPAKVTVEKIMTTPIASIEHVRTPQDAHDMMGDLGIRHLGISKAGEIVGMISVRDLLRYFQKQSEPKITQD